MKKLYLFDFDGTITQLDSLFHFMVFAKGKVKAYVWLALISPLFILSKFKLFSADKAKEILFTWAFKGYDINAFDSLCNQFATTKLPQLVYPEFHTLLQNINQEPSSSVVVVSASIKNYLKPWCDTYQLQLICTELQVSNNKITGKFSTPNCNYEQKVMRIKNIYNLDDFDSIYTYGNSSGDKPMLELGTKSYYNPFAKNN